MKRAATTYRANRRNQCLRADKAVWGPQWYYEAHRNSPRWASARHDNKTAIVRPYQSRGWDYSKGPRPHDD